MDSYELRYGVQHAASSGQPITCKTIISPDYVRHKSATLESVGPVLNEINLAIEGCCRAKEFPDALSFALLKQRLSNRERSEFAGVEAALQIQSGKVASSLSQVTALGTADDRVIAFAQAIASQTGSDRRLVENYTKRLLAISRKCSPWAIELAAEIIAATAPQVACKLARRISEPSELFDFTTGEENPTSGRCLFRIFKRLVIVAGDVAKRTVGELKSKREQAIAQVAMAVATLDQNVAVAAGFLRRGLALLPHKSDRRYLMTKYFLWQAARQPSDKAAAILLILDRDFALQPEHLLLTDFIDQKILAAPGQWLELRNNLRSTTLRSFVSWRLAELGHLNSSEIGKETNSEMTERLLASAITGFMQTTDPGEADEVARQLKSPAGFAAVLASALRRIETGDHEEACISAAQAIGALSKWPAQPRLLGLACLRDTVLNLGAALRAQLIAQCLGAIRDWDPRCDRGDADAAVWRRISRFIAEAPSQRSSRFRLILEVSESERWKKFAATKVLTFCDLDLCRTVARKPQEFDLLNGKMDEGHLRSHALLPETQIGIAVAAAKRLGRGDRPLVCQLLSRAIDYLPVIADPEVRQECWLDAMTCAMIVSPAFVQRLIGDLLPNARDFLTALKEVLTELRRRPMAAETFVRYQLEIYQPPEDLQSEKLRRTFIARRQAALQEDVSYPTLATVADSGVDTKQWFGELIDLIGYSCECLDSTAGTSNTHRREQDLSALNEVAAMIAEGGNSRYHG